MDDLIMSENKGTQWSLKAMQEAAHGIEGFACMCNEQ